MRQKIGFIYYTFYPVTGGASVHGINLARELNRLGYRLYKLNGMPDPWTTKMNRSIPGLYWILRNCDLIYIRMDYFFNFRNLIGLISILAGKRVVVELNSPSDELHLFGRGDRYIRMADRLYRWLLKKAARVIVVSDEVETYCREALHLERVSIIRNGGEIFNRDQLVPSSEIKNRMDGIRSRYRKIVIWAGSVNSMQNLDWMRQTAGKIDEDTALLLVLNQADDEPVFSVKSDQFTIFRNIDRDDVKYLIAGSDAGIAFYTPYPWSRWGFYNSSLKIDEYLNNGLLTITNIEGTEVQQAHPGYRRVHSPDEAAGVIRTMNTGSKKTGQARTWEDVARETAEVFEDILGR